MILLRLLSAGKTLVGVGQNERSYRLPQERALPRFGGKKNPFRATTLPDAVQAENAGSVEPPAESEPRVAAQEIEEPAAVACAAEPAEAKPAKPVATPFVVRAKNWFESIRGLLRRTAPSRISRGSFEANARPLQGELGLESVRVVRNDLSETDIEIVPRKEAASRRVEQAAVRAPAAEPSAASDSSWSRVSARIFGNNVR